MILAIVLLVGSCLLFPLLPSNAFGDQGSSSFDFTITLPNNTTLDHTDQAAQKVEGLLAGIQDIQTYQTTVGTSDASSAAASSMNVADFTVNVKPDSDASKVERTVSDRLKKLSDIGTTSFSSEGANVVDIAVQASDDQSLHQATQQVMDTVKNVPNTTDIKSNLSDVVPLVNVQVNPAKAALHGLTAVQIAQILQLVYSGTTATHIVLDGNNTAQQDVDLKLDTSANTVQEMQEMQILSPTGPVRLGDVADVSQVGEPTQIVHFNSARTTTITFSVTSQNVQGVAENVQQRMTKLHLPAGAKASLGAASSGSQDALNQFYLVLLFAVPMVFIVMVATFRSLIQPLILLISIPFAAIGSIVLSVMTQTAIGISSLFGALMLIGIVVTNAIVLIDRINYFRIEGLEPRAAVIAGGRQRVRPILMTALATIMALIPMAVGTGGGSALIISGGLAIVVIGGLTSSTFLTLLLVPTLYVIVENMRKRWKKQQQVLVPFAMPHEAEDLAYNTMQPKSQGVDMQARLIKMAEFPLPSNNSPQLYKEVEYGENNFGDATLDGYIQGKEGNLEKQQKRQKINSRANTTDLQKQMRLNGTSLSHKSVAAGRKKSGEIEAQSMRPTEATTQIKIVSGSGRTLRIDVGKGKPKVEGPQETRNAAAGPYIYTYPVKVHSTERGTEVSCCDNKVKVLEDHIKIETSEIDATTYITKKHIRLKIETSSEKINLFSIDEERPESPIEYTKIANGHNDTYSLAFRRFDEKNPSKGSFSYLGEMIVERGKNIQRKITGKDGVDIEIITYHDGNDIQIYRNGKVIIVEDFNDKRIVKFRKQNVINVELQHKLV